MTHKYSYSMEIEGKKYIVYTDDSMNIVSAKLAVKAHDKRLTMRSVTNKVTLKKLQMLFRPNVCNSCGQHIKEPV